MPLIQLRKWEKEDFPIQASTSKEIELFDRVNSEEFGLGTVLALYNEEHKNSLLLVEWDNLTTGHNGNRQNFTFKIKLNKHCWWVDKRILKRTGVKDER